MLLNVNSTDQNYSQTWLSGYLSIAVYMLAFWQGLASEWLQERLIAGGDYQPSGEA